MLSNDTFSDVACPTMTDCVAIGSSPPWNSTGVPLTEVWDGTSWAIRPTPSPKGATREDLNGLSCISGDACFAVGSAQVGTATQPLVEEWNGSHWSAELLHQPASTTQAELNSVSCPTSSTCIAVGGFLNQGGQPVPFAETWSFSSWSKPTVTKFTGVAAYFYSIDCASASSCMAVGSIPLDTSSFRAEYWNGKTWTLIKAPAMTPPRVAEAPNASTVTSSFAVSCPTTESCTAIPIVTKEEVTPQQVVYAWNGTSWSSTVTGPQLLTAIACGSATSCVAVGFVNNSASAAAVFSWNGTALTNLAVATPASSSLLGITCSPTCEAVGSQATAATGITVLVVRERGTSWTDGTAPSPPDADPGTFQSVSCPSDSWCEAVGTEGVPALAENWDGTAWSWQATPLPGHDALRSVSCPTVTWCVSVGWFGGANSGGPATDTHPVAALWTSSGWSALDPKKPNNENSYFTSVSCPVVDACYAVGTVSEFWNGSTWTLLKLPTNPLYAFQSISCSSTDACMAVGDKSGTNGSDAAIAYYWNGATWTLESPAAPPYSSLTGVSCLASMCMAVGVTFSDFPGVPLAEEWNGTSWTIEKLPPPSSGSTTPLASVSCVTSSSCIAVGAGRGTGNGTLQSSSYSWTGTAWKALTTPSPGVSNELVSVSCAASAACTAVGGVRPGGQLVERYS